MKKVRIIATITLGVTLAFCSIASASEKTATSPATIGGWKDGGVDFAKNAKSISARTSSSNMPIIEKTATAPATLGSWTSGNSETGECTAWFARF